MTPQDRRLLSKDLSRLANATVEQALEHPESESICPWMEAR